MFEEAGYNVSLTMTRRKRLRLHRKETSFLLYMLGEMYLDIDLFSWLVNKRR